MDESFKDTIVMFVSDHGVHDIALHFRLTTDENVRQENFLPFMFAVVPNDVPRRYHDNLKVNQQRFFSGYDFYASMRSLALGGPVEPHPVLLPPRQG